jgi:hypothetical protein
MAKKDAAPEKTGPSPRRRNARPMQQATISTPALARAGLIGGLVGAILIDAYLLTIYVFVGHALTLEAFYQLVAAGAIGRAAAFATPSAAWLGLGLHLMVSIGWGLGFAYIAARTPQVGERPLISGIVFGAVVMLSMWLIEFAAAIWNFPTVATFENDLVAHVLFFGLPVAYVVAWDLRRS